MGRVEGATGSWPGRWSVPHAPNPYFTGRAKILNEVRTALQDHHVAVLSQAHGLSIHGGLGKTQAALAYILRGRKDYEAVFWIRAASPLGLALECLELGRALGLAAPREDDYGRVVLAVQRWLADHRDWLVVFEDVRQPAFIASWLPHELKGQVLIVTTGVTAEAPPRGVRVEVPVMPAEEAMHFLFKRTGRLARDRSERDAATDLARALMQVPLALELAGAYMAMKALSFADYLKQVREHTGKERKVGSGTDTIMKGFLPAWTLTAAAIEQESPAAMELLRASTWFDGHRLPVSLLEPGGDGPSAAEAAPRGDGEISAEVNAALEVLARYSVIRRGLDPREVVVPTLVQVLMKEALPQSARRSAAWQAVKAVHRRLEAEAEGPWSGPLARQAERGADLIREYRFDELEAGQVLRRLGVAQARCGDYAGAGRSLGLALEIYEKLPDSHRAEHAGCLHETGLVALERAEYDEAKTALDRAVLLASQTLPGDHPDIATYLHSLGRLHALQHKVTEAERCYRQALSLRERVLSAEDPEVAVAANSLAALLHDQRRYAEAESLMKHAVYIVKRALPPDHPDIAACVHNLAVVLHSRRRYADAEHYYREALARKEQGLPPSHPGLLVTLESYAVVLRKLHRSGEAAALEARARTLRRTDQPSEITDPLATPA